ncbi:MAG: hypothetical protein J6C11_05470 [Spirochaetaceae bacterium]|nr:hypothetical protein [Spirochaetaceae bacterium]
MDKNPVCLAKDYLLEELVRYFLISINNQKDKAELTSALCQKIHILAFFVI